MPVLRFFRIPLAALGALVLSLTLAACEGPVGPEGPAGPEGPRGEQGERGPAGAANVNSTIVTLAGENFSREELNSGTALVQAFDYSVLNATLADEGIVLPYLKYQGTDQWELLPIRDTYTFGGGSPTIDFNARFLYEVGGFTFFVQTFRTLTTDEFNELALNFGGLQLKVVTVPPSAAASSGVEVGMSHSEAMARLGQ